MEKEIIYMLKDYGLEDNEIKIYLFLVGNKELTAYKIAKETKIHRSTCYDILERLNAKGFVSKINKEKSSFYRANDVSKLLTNLKVKENLLLNLAPKLNELEKQEETKIKYLEGIEGQSQFTLEVFNLAKQRKIKYCYIIGNTYAATIGSNIFIDKLIRELKKSGVFGEYKGIWNPKYKGDKLVGSYNLIGENRFLDIPSAVGMIIYELGVAFLYTTNNSYTIDIKNKKLAEEMKAYFEYLWKIAKK
jgi:predicted transcriptional regulator